MNHKRDPRVQRVGGAMLGAALFGSLFCGCLDPGYECDGTPPPCTIRTAEQCDVGTSGGCSAGPGCTPPNCSNLPQASCVLRVGCSFDPQKGCFPTDSCTSADSEATCSANAGCTWSDTCHGIPLRQCSYHTKVECLAVPNCTWNHIEED